MCLRRCETRLTVSAFAYASRLQLKQDRCLDVCQHLHLGGDEDNTLRAGDALL